MKILIVDDHELIREGLKKVLVKQTDMEVIGEAADTETLFEKLNDNEVDIIILDISLPGRSGLDILKDINDLFPSVKILVLSMHPEERFAVRAIKAGAAGYLTKQSVAEDLVKAIRKIAGGGKYISTSLAEHIAFEIGGDLNKPLHENLSNREFEVLRMISAGKTVSEIAESLSLSVNTVNSYRSRIMDKMNMKSNAELIRYALENQLVE